MNFYLCVFALILVSLSCLQAKPYPDIFVNSSQTGVYKFADGTRVYTTWYQDDAAQKITIQIGTYSVDGFEVFYYFTSSGFYYYYYNGTATCTYSTASNYYDECTAYGSDYLSYLGTFQFVHAHDERIVDSYVGYAPDAVGFLDVNLYVDYTTGLYTGMAIVGNNTDGSAPVWSQYWYNHLTAGVPDAKHFVLPAECTSATTSSLQVTRASLAHRKDFKKF